MDRALPASTRLRLSARGIRLQACRCAMPALRRPRHRAYPTNRARLLAVGTGASIPIIISDRMVAIGAQRSRERVLLTERERVAITLIGHDRGGAVTSLT